jgi:hypothetical protein
MRQHTMRQNTVRENTVASAHPREEGIDGRQAFRLIQQRYMAALCDLELRKVGNLGFHSCESSGAQYVGSLAANRQQGYAAQPLPEGP